MKRWIKEEKMRGEIPGTGIKKRDKGLHIQNDHQTAYNRVG
jgi:hypothetical protein